MNQLPGLPVMNILIVNGCLIVPVNGDISDDYLWKVQKAILEKVKATCSKKVLIDVSAVKVLDSFTFSLLENTARMVSMLGARVVFVGFQAGVASALVDLNVELGDLLTAVTVEDGLGLLCSQESVETVIEYTESASNSESIITC